MDSNILDNVDSQELGQRLKDARTKKGLRQEDAAEVLGVARTTITAIEKGERRIKASELIKLAKAYERKIRDLISPDRPSLDRFVPQFRGPNFQETDLKPEIQKAIDNLEELAINFIELERITNAPLKKRYPEEHDIENRNLYILAETIAIEERNRLGLGDGPIPHIRDILEIEVGIRIFYLPLPSEYSAIYIYNDQLGGCIAVNSNHIEERRRFSLAHDYGHFLTTRQKSELLEENNQVRPLSEVFADLFAMYFLLPSSSLMRQFNNLKVKYGKVTPAALCDLANYYGVSFEALCRRLEQLNLIKTGTLDKLKANGFKVREAQKQLGIEPLSSRDHKFPRHYLILAIDAFDNELISEGQFAHFLQLNRIQARRMAETLRSDDIEVADQNLVDFPQQVTGV